MRFRFFAVSLLLFPMVDSAHAALTFVAPLRGENERPAPVASPGTGFVVLKHDVSGTLEVNLSFSGLSSGVTAAHIHCCATLDTNAGVAIDLDNGSFPIGATSGAFSHTFDLNDPDTFDSNYLNDSGGTALLAHIRLASSLERLIHLPGVGIAYVNVHTTMHPDGELRGNIQLLPIPEPLSLSLLLFGAAGICGLRRRR